MWKLVDWTWRLQKQWQQTLFPESTPFLSRQPWRMNVRPALMTQPTAASGNSAFYSVEVFNVWPRDWWRTSIQRTKVVPCPCAYWKNTLKTVAGLSHHVTFRLQAVRSLDITRSLKRRVLEVPAKFSSKWSEKRKLEIHWWRSPSKMRHTELEPKFGEMDRGRQEHHTHLQH